MICTRLTIKSQERAHESSNRVSSEQRVFFVQDKEKEDVDVARASPGLRESHELDWACRIGAVCSVYPEGGEVILPCSEAHWYCGGYAVDSGNVC